MQDIAAVHAVERLAVGVLLVNRIKRLFLRVGTDTDLRACGTTHVVISQKSSRAPQVFGVGAQFRAQVVDRLLAVSHPVFESSFHFWRQRRGVEWLAGDDADALEFLAQRDLALIWRLGELQQKGELIENLQRRALLCRRDRWDPVDRRWSDRLGANVGRQRLYLVSGYDLLDVVEVAGIEKLRAAYDLHDLGLRSNHFLDSIWRIALPSRASNQIVSAAVSGCTAAEIGEVECKQVQELKDEVPVLLNWRQRDDHRLGAQIEGDEGIGCVRIGRDERCILRSEHAYGGVGNDIQWPPVCLAGLVDVEHIHRRIEAYHRD